MKGRGGSGGGEKGIESSGRNKFKGSDVEESLFCSRNSGMASHSWKAHTQPWERYASCLPLSNLFQPPGLRTAPYLVLWDPRFRGESRQALELNHPGLPAMALLTSNENETNTHSGESGARGAHLGGDPDSITRCRSQTQKLRLSQEKLLAQDNPLLRCHQPFHPVWHPGAFPSLCQAHGNKQNCALSAFFI